MQKRSFPSFDGHDGGMGSATDALHRSRPPFWDFFRSVWSVKKAAAYSRYKNKDGIILCRDGRVFREKHHRLYGTLTGVMPLVILILMWIPYVPPPDASRITTAAELSALNAAYEYDRRLVGVIVALGLLAVYFIVFPLVRYFFNHFKQIREEDPADRHEFS